MLLLLTLAPSAIIIYECANGWGAPTQSSLPTRRARKTHAETCTISQ